MHRRIYDSLKDKPKLQNNNVSLQSVNGEHLKLDGYATIPFEIGGHKMSQPFYIVRNMNRKLILGRDWLQNNGVRLYQGQSDIHPFAGGSSHFLHCACTHKTKVKPQTAVICKCKVRNNPGLPTSGSYQISPAEIGFLNYEPGLMVTSSVAKMTGNRFIPVLLVNNTNKTYTVR